MTDQLERLLREQFAQDAENAPGAHGLVPSELAAAGRAAVRAHRRRHVVIGLSALAAAVVVPFALLGGPGGRGGAEVATPDRSPGTTKLIADGTLTFRGVVVPVPKAMLDPANRYCGSSLADAAWFTRGEVATTCGLTRPRTNLTEVELTVAGTLIAEDRVAGSRVLDDGRTRVVRLFDDRALRLIVTSPDATRAREIADSAEALSPEVHLYGCSVGPSTETRTLPGFTRDPIVPEKPVGGVVCGHDDGWLVEAHVLTATEAQRLAREILAAPAGIHESVRDCKSAATLDSTGFWRVELIPEGEPPVKLTVTPRSCSEGAAGVMDGGQLFELTDSLAKALYGFAAGPSRW